MHSKKPPTGDVPGSIGDEPEERRRHHLWLDQFGAVEARLIGNHRSIGHSTWNQDVHGNVYYLRLDLTVGWLSEPVYLSTVVKQP